MAVFPALFGFLIIAIVKGQEVEISPREAVRRVGAELVILCKVPYPIDSCRLVIGSDSYRLVPSNQDEEVVYSGNGLQFGECGGLIKRVREEWNGNISCVVPRQTGSMEVSAAMRLLVAKPPGEPQLVTPAQSSFVEGDSFMAQCVVPNGRPAAKITWYLDGEQLLNGVHQPIIRAEPGSDLETISQNVSMSLTPDDNAKTLTCRAEHEAMDMKETSRQIIVQYPPKRIEGNQDTIFGLKIGEEGRLNVTVRANPAPSVAWTVGDMRVTPGGGSSGSDDNSVVALEPVALNSGYYNVTLVLTRVAKEDVDRTYYLHVGNSLGQEEFKLRLSTMAEPAARKANSSYLTVDVYGVELGAGAVVAIVVGVLALLVAVSLAVFAKATDRWCFGGNRSRDHTKSSGESSDTESAAGGGHRSRLSALGARVRAALPRPRDRVQAAAVAEPRDEELGDEKKSVVYAELALSETVEKPPPHSAEYAEIVCGEQPPVPAPAAHPARE